jgi:hypothetical protein
MNFFLSLGSDLGQAQACCWVQTVNGITTPPSRLLDLLHQYIYKHTYSLITDVL